MNKAAIILAAGQGKRMKSDLPKVLHLIQGRPMIELLLDRLESMDFDRLVVVVGHRAEMVKTALSSYDVVFVRQVPQLGTAHAVQMAGPVLADFEGLTLVAAGDVPFLSSASIESLFATHLRTRAAATCLSAVFDDPTGYGRIVREDNTDYLTEIVEHRDATPEVLKIKEINSGTFCFDNRILFETINRIGTDNVQGEYYLTDAVRILHDEGRRVAVVKAANPDEVLGVNSIEQLEYLAGKFAH